MKNKTIVEELQKFPKDTTASLNLKLAKYSVLEICYHSGNWDGVTFSCESQTNWKHAQAESDFVDLEELITLLSEKTIEEMSSDDFQNLSLGDSTDGSIEVDEIEFDGNLTEEQRSEINPMDLYMNSDINDSDVTFPENSIWCMEINVNGEKFTIEN